MQYVEKALPWIILAVLVYHIRATYEVTVPGAYKLLTKAPSAA